MLAISQLVLVLTACIPSINRNSDSASSKTKSAVEDGTLIVCNQDEQKQNVDDLSRDTENANNPLGQIFDKQKEQDKMDALDLVRDIAAQARDTLGDKATEDEVNKLAYSYAVDKQVQINQEKGKTNGGMGSTVSKGIDAATAIVSGLITGDFTGGLAGASAPYIAGIIKEQTYESDDKGNIRYDDKGDPKVNTEANLIAHAILGAAVAAAQGNSALAGGIGAVSGEAAADYIRKTLYDGRAPSDLTQAEKENISALAQLASGLAVAAGSGGNIGDVGTAVAGSKNAVENNYLYAPEDKIKTDLERQLPYLSPEDKEKAQAAIDKINQSSKEKNEALIDACQNLSSSKCGELRQDLDAAGKSYDGKLSPDDPYYHYLQSQYKDQYDGYKEINSLEFDLALKDVEAYREWKAQQLTENYGFSIETSRNLVFWERVSNTAMAAAAAIVGPKVVQEATGTKPPVISTEKGTSTTANKPNNIVGEAVGDIGKGPTGSQTITNDILDNPRVGYGEKGSGSGNKVDQITNKPVLDIDGQQITVYPEKLKPGAVQEFPSTAKSHGFNDIIDNYAGQATKTTLNNGATLHQLEGSLNGVSGRFEWIVDPKLGGVSHRMFVPNGKINGAPSKP
ncbi:VENN motif pre-toxin domain-containing protein [Orbus wheelerorum]|uniref:VENN motif pre-toxin domain-containing protein n=1 Tax=Orbus wheelerorum TaxID=3074111 RepID=UPI00370D30C0